jgi:hypothetical protein
VALAAMGTASALVILRRNRAMAATPPAAVLDAEPEEVTP